MPMENYFWETEENNYTKKIFLLIIYDIVDNKRRNRFFKEMKAFGFHVQYSAFEALVSEQLFHKLQKEIPKYINPEVDSVRMYRMTGYGEVDLFGLNTKIEAEDVIII